MKTRQGFVSNSSSSSFVLLLPENFLETIDYDKIVSDYDEEDRAEFPLDDLKRLFEDFVKNGGMYLEDVYSYDDGEWDFCDILIESVELYEVASLDTHSGEGQYIVLNREKLKELL